MSKKNGVLAALVLATLGLIASSSGLLAQTPQAPVAAIAAPQTTAPAPALEVLQLPASLLQTPAATPASTTNVIDILSGGSTNVTCQCTVNAQCGSGNACCWLPKRNCGICC